MRNNLHIQLDSYTIEESAFPWPECGDYLYWPPLISHFLKTANHIEIHCWNEEIDVTEELVMLFAASLEKDMKEKYTVFSGFLNAEIKKYLTENCTNVKGEFKWFSIFLSSDKNTEFHAEHWATEFFVPDISEAENLYVRKILPENTSFYLYRDKF